jgi:hypothetical protein
MSNINGGLGVGETSIELLLQDTYLIGGLIQNMGFGESVVYEKERKWTTSFSDSVSRLWHSHEDIMVTEEIQPLHSLGTNDPLDGDVSFERHSHFWYCGRHIGDVHPSQGFSRRDYCLYR